MSRSRTLALSAGVVAAAVIACAQDPGAQTARDVYRTKCQSCHGVDGNARVEALALARGQWKHGSSPDEIAKVIADGVPGTAMRPFKAQLTPEQIAALADLVRSFDKSKGASEGQPQPQGQDVRPKITGIARVRVFATSVEKSSAFYSHVLGLTAGGCGASTPCYPVNDHQRIEIVASPATPPASLLAEVAFATPDVERMHRFLAAHGVAPGPIATDADGAQRFALADPEGHPIAFVQETPRPGWSAPKGQVSARLLHAGFVVRDAAALDRFYRELLGFRMYWHGGMKETDTDWLEIQVPDGEDWIEYMLNVDPKAGRDERGVMNHFALGVTSLAPAVGVLRAHGLKSDAEPEIGRDGKWQFDIFDPDATRVELMELKPTRAPCCHPYEAPHPNE